LATLPKGGERERHDPTEHIDLRLVAQPPSITVRPLEGEVRGHSATLLVIALHFLDEGLARPFLAGLSKYQALAKGQVKAARDSLADPQCTEIMVTLIDPYEITSTQRPHVSLVVDDKRDSASGIRNNDCFRVQPLLPIPLPRSHGPGRQ
jgi:hypothetical protein